MIASHKSLRSRWEEAVGNAGPMRQEGSSPRGYWGLCFWSFLGASPAHHLLASTEPLENQATQGAFQASLYPAFIYF